MTYSRTLRYFLLTTAFFLSLAGPVRAGLTDYSVKWQFSAFAKPSDVTTEPSPAGGAGAAATGVNSVFVPLHTVHISNGRGDGSLSLEIPAGSSIIDLAGLPLSNLPYRGGEVYTIENYQVFFPVMLRSDNPYPISWWKGDGDANDSVGEHNGALYGGVSFVTGVSGSAFHLDGEDDYVEIPHHLDLNPETESFSVLVWVYPEQAPWNRIIMKGNLDPTDYYISYSSNKPDVAFASEIGGWGDRTWTSYSAVLSDQWYHLALVRDRSLNLVKLYVNGSLDQASQVAVDVTGGISNESPLVFGRNATDLVEFFKGSLDEVKYFNYAVTPEQIQAEINSACPQVISIERTSAVLTNAASVDFIVTFSEEVGSVGVEDFITTGSVTGAAVSGVTPVSASVYTVHVSTGSGDGTLSLEIPAGSSIMDLAGLPLSNLPYTSGEVYTIVSH